MFVSSLSPAYMTFGIIIIVGIIFMYIKNIRLELYEESVTNGKKQDLKGNASKKTVPPHFNHQEDNEEELIMAAAAHYYLMKSQEK